MDVPHLPRNLRPLFCPSSEADPYRLLPEDRPGRAAMGRAAGPPGSMVLRLGEIWTERCRATREEKHRGKEAEGDQNARLLYAAQGSLTRLAMFSYYRVARLRCWVRGDLEMKRKLPPILATLFIFWCWSLPAGANCTSMTGCTDCSFGADGKARCAFVDYDASCECTVLVMLGSTACSLDGACDYTSGGGGGGNGGGGSGGGGSCTRSPGGWCPAECPSCGVAYWY